MPCFFFPGRDVGLVWGVSPVDVSVFNDFDYEISEALFSDSHFFRSHLFSVSKPSKRDCILGYMCSFNGIFVVAPAVFFCCNNNPPTKARRPWGSRRPNVTQRPRPTRGRVVPCTKSAPEMVNLPLPKVPPLHPEIAGLIYLGGFLKDYVFSPQHLGKWSNFTDIFFRWVGSTTN